MRHASLSRSTASLLLLAALLASGLAMLPATTAQSFGPEMRGPQDGRLAHGIMNEVVLFEDATGDAYMIPEMEGDGTPYADAGDIVSLSAGETATHLLFSIEHKAYDATASTLSEFVVGHDHYCQMSFHLGDDEDRVFRIDIYGDQFLDGGEFRYGGQARFTVYDRADDFTVAASTFLGPIPVALVAGDHLEVLFDKRFLGAASENGTAAFPPAGTELAGLGLDCQRSVLFIGYRDDLENADPLRSSYALQVSGENEHIRLTLSGTTLHATPSGDVIDAIAAQPGKGRKATLAVENLGDRKLLVNLTTRFVDDTGEPVEGWKVALAPTIEVRSRNVTEASLVVVPPADALHRSGGWLFIEGRPLGREGVATRALRVVANTALGPETDTLHFHVTADSGGCFLCTGGQTPLSPFVQVNEPHFVLNTLEDDPDHSEDVVAGDTLPFFADTGMRGGLDMPLARPIRFDPEGTIAVTLALATDVEREIEATVRMFGDGDVYIGGTTQEIVVGQRLTTHTFTIRPNEDALGLNGMIEMDIAFQESGLTGFFGGTAWVSDLDWDPSASMVVLPLLEYVEPEFQVTDGTALPTLQLLSKRDTEQYVNPGKTKVFELQLVNEGTIRDELEVEVKASDPRWIVQLEPCCRYRLDPGATAPFSVLLTSPDEATEGDEVYVNLTATSRNDAEARTSLSLHAIITTGIDLEDETYSQPDEYVKPLRDDRDSPTSPLMGSVLVALVGLGLARRRLHR